MNRRVPLAVAGLVLALAFLSLGRWQLGREGEKRALLAAAEAALAAAPEPLADALADAGTAPRRVAGRVRFLETPPLWLDNQRRGERVGVKQYCAATAADGQALLLDLGWLPLAADRQLPAQPCPGGELQASGLLVPPPAAGLALGEGLARQPDGQWLALRLEPQAVAAAWSLPGLAPLVLRLDPALPVGHPRDLDLLPNTLPPEKHRGYALQWFGLAATTFVFVLILMLRRRP